MTLLAPWAIWLAAVGGAVVALYILRIKRRRQTVPSLDFWRRLAGQTQMRSLFQRIKRWISMLLWLLIVMCLLLAVGEPILSFGSIKPRSIVMIIDNTASMQTIEDKETGGMRLADAFTTMRDIMARRPVSDEWMLIEATREPRVLQPWTRNRSDIEDASESVQPFFGSGDLNNAIALAEQLLEGKEWPTIITISDQLTELPVEDKNESHAGSEESPQILRVQWLIGSESDNVGITDVSVRLHREQSLHFVFVRAVNASAERIETELVYEIDGSAARVEALTIEPGGTWEKTVALNAPDGGVLRVYLDRPDGLEVDNEAYAVLQPIKPAVVWLVTNEEDGFFFEQAVLAMDPLVSLDNSRTMTPSQYESLGPDMVVAESPDLIVFNNFAPDILPESGNFVLINEFPRDDMPWRVIGEIERPEIRIDAREHPLARHLHLDPVRLVQARRIDLVERAQILARTANDDPLIFFFEQPDRRVLGLAFDVLDSDLPFRNAFPLLLRNAVTYFSVESARRIPDQHRIGEVISPQPPLAMDVSEINVARIGTGLLEEKMMTISGGVFRYELTDRPAAIRFDLPDDSLYTAVNLADISESRNAPDENADNPEDQIVLSGRFLGGTPWLALATIALVLVSLEWFTFHRRWTE